MRSANVSKVEFQGALEPTVFFRGDHRIADLKMTGLSRPAPVGVQVEFADTANVFDMTHSFDLGVVPAGDSVHELELPDHAEKVNARVTIVAGGRSESHNVAIPPARKWTLYVFHHSHCDVGFTHTPNQVVHLHNKYTDSAIEYCRASAKWDPDSRFKWVVETSWQAQNYLKMRSEARIKEFLRLARQGRIEISAMYLGEHLDNLGNEALIRSIYFGGRLRREYGLPITSAMLCDVTGFPWQFGQILARAGIKYFHWAPNGFASAFHHYHSLKRPFRWESPDGSRTLVWHTDDPLWAYIEGYRWGLDKSLDVMRVELPKKLADLDESKYPYDIFPMEAACDNGPPLWQVAENVRNWNRRYTYPRLVFSTVTDFFEAFERLHGERFPVVRGDLNNSWGRIIAGYPYETSFECDTRERLQAIERTVVPARLASGRDACDRADIAHAYDDVLVFEEHSGTGFIWKCKSERDQHNAIKQGLSYAYHARDLSKDLAEQATAALATQIPSPSKGAVAVWNSLFHERDALVEVPVVPSRIGEGVLLHAEEIGGGNERLPVQVVTRLVDGKQSACALIPARRLPSYGYRCYILRSGAAAEEGAVEAGVGAAGGGWLESRFYRIELNPYTGEIASVFDKELRRELVDSKSLGRFTEMIYYQPLFKRPLQPGEDMTKFTDMYSPDPIPGELRRVPRPREKRNDTVVAEDGPLRARLLVPAEPISSPMLRREYILYRDEKRLDLCLTTIPLPGNPILYEELLSHAIGSAYLSFPFAVPEGRFAIEYGHGTLRPITDQLPGACLDHYSMGHWCGLSNAESGVVFVSRNMPKIELGQPNAAKLGHDRKHPAPAIYVPIGDHHRTRVQMKKYAFLKDIRPERHGPVPFRFSLTSHAGPTRIAQAHRFGWNVANPPATLPLKSKSGALPAGACSFCGCESKTVVVSHIKPAEDGDGIILRLWEIAGRGDTATLTFPHWSLTHAWRASILEENESELACAGDRIRMKLGPNEIATVRLLCKMKTS